MRSQAGVITAATDTDSGAGGAHAALHGTVKEEGLFRLAIAATAYWKTLFHICALLILFFRQKKVADSSSKHNALAKKQHQIIPGEMGWRRQPALYRPKEVSVGQVLTWRDTSDPRHHGQVYGRAFQIW